MRSLFKICTVLFSRTLIITRNTFKFNFTAVFRPRGIIELLIWNFKDTRHARYIIQALTQRLTYVQQQNEFLKKS